MASVLTEVRFELASPPEDRIKKWNVEAIHVTTTANNREYTEEELRTGAKSFSFRPLNINHDRTRWLHYNWQDPRARDSNATLEMDYDASIRGVKGQIQVVSSIVNEMIATGKIVKLSIEQIPAQGETCSCNMPAGSCKCIQHGVTGLALALLEAGVTPGDAATVIRPESLQVKGEPFGDYKDFADCLAKNMDKDDPKAYCGSIQARAESDNIATNILSLLSSLSTATTTNSQKLSTETAQVKEPAPAIDKKSESTTITKLPGVLDDRIVAFSPDQFDKWIKNNEQRQLEALEKSLGVFKTTIEKLNEAYAPKAGATATQVEAMNKPKAVNMEKLGEVADWIKNGADSGHKTFKLDRDEYMRSQGFILDEKGQIIGRTLIAGRDAQSTKTEALTSGTQAIDYVRSPITIPGGQLVVPIRQFVNYQTFSAADRVAWYTQTTFAFGSITEGSEPGEGSSTITQVTATPTTRGAFFKLKYSQIEDNPYPIVQYMNGLALRASVDAESTEILDTIANAGSPETGHWRNGNTGAAITSDDTSGMTLTISGVSAAKNALDVQGYMTQGPYVFAVHPKNYNELIISSGIDTFAQNGIPEITRTGILSSILGVQMVEYDQVHAQDNTTNDTYRNIMFVPGQQTFGLAVSRELTIKAEEHSELQQLYWTATHRIAGKIIDNKAWVRVSCAQ